MWGQCISIACCHGPDKSSSMWQWSVWQTSKISKINAVHFPSEDLHKNMKSLRLWSGPLPSESCCIFLSAASGLFVKLESLGKWDSRSCSVYCKICKSTAYRHYCYKWWWTWLGLPSASMPAVQKRLKASLSSIGLIFVPNLPQKDLCSVGPSTAMPGQRKQKRNRQSAHSSFFIRHCCLCLSRSRIFKLFKWGSKVQKDPFFF